MRNLLLAFLLVVCIPASSATAGKPAEEDPLGLIQSQIQELKAANEIDEVMLDGRLRSIEFRLRNVVRDEADRTKDWVQDQRSALDTAQGLFTIIVTLFSVAVPIGLFFYGRHNKAVRDDFKHSIDKKLAKADSDSRRIEEDARIVRNIKADIAFEMTEIEKV